MHRSDLPEASADTRLDEAISWLASATPPDQPSWKSIASASADASFRRYFRVTSATGATAIVMDAPPPQEDVRPFVNMTHLLANGGVHVPELFAEIGRAHV